MKLVISDDMSKQIQEKITMKQTMLPGIALTLIALAIAGLVVMLYQYLPLAQNLVKLQRWSVCASAYRLEYSDEQNKTVVISPNAAEVSSCMKALQ